MIVRVIPADALLRIERAMSYDGRGIGSADVVAVVADALGIQWSRPYARPAAEVEASLDTLTSKGSRGRMSA